MNKKLAQSIAKLAKVSDVDGFIEALQSESDTDFELPKVVVRTADEEESFKTNLLDNAKGETTKAAREILIKNMKKEIGLEFEGKKPEDFITNYKKHILDEAKIEPNKKIQELTESNDTLRKKLEDKDGEFDQLKSSYADKELKLNTQSFIPTLPESLGLNKSEASSLFFMSHEIKDGQVYKNGELLKNANEKPLTHKEAVDAFVTEKNWIEDDPSGRGGGSGNSRDSGGDGLTLQDFEDACTEKGLKMGSAEANALLDEMAKENPEILN